MQANVSAHHKQHLEDLAARPNTTVLTVTHEETHDPWPVARLQPLFERLVGRVVAFDDDATSDFAVRKTCLDDPEVLAFQRAHPKLYWMLTDRKLMRDPRCRSAVTGMLHVRAQVEMGALEAGRDADAQATQSVLSALGAPQGFR